MAVSDLCITSSVSQSNLKTLFLSSRFIYGCSKFPTFVLLVVLIFLHEDFNNEKTLLLNMGWIITV